MAAAPASDCDDSISKMAHSKSKSGRTLAEKGKHLDPLVGCHTGQTGDRKTGDSGVQAAGDAGQVTTSCENSEASSRSTGNGRLVSTEVKTSSMSCPHTDFKLGADSVDEPGLDNVMPVMVDGFLSPTSPTSPVSPGSCSPDGLALKSSLRDPHRPKTPPGTPHRKSVRFADALGLDLETVKTILRTESPPDLPGLNVHVDEEKQTITVKSLTMCFQQPGGRADFISRLYNLNVCLENLVVHEFTLIGTIKVRNLGFEKNVRIRHSSDNWNSYVDVMGMYVQGSCDGPTDRFSFGLSAPRSLVPGGILSFAVYYKVAGKIFWDNNNGQNYSLVCEVVKKESSKR
ncbi:protein phosphatase 1 regulatory subunit 3B-like [Diadema antillarum]|uniref:protein phosphatase 1 regulatory subunit 3B-like n=1 Tax=Diadema antillarum TaxID=105358 RepID=UPI003A8C87F0